MRKLIPIVLFFIPLEFYAQNSPLGIYYNYFGAELIINSDSTFNYIRKFDLSSSWTNGNWMVRNDTVYLTTILVFDTLISTNNKSIIVLSDDNKSSSLKESEYAISQISSGGQNQHLFIDKYYFRKNRLIEIDQNGKLITQKKSYVSKTKYIPWFIKKENQ